VEKKVLIVEDEYDIGSTMELVLEMENHEVRLCSNGEEALSILASEALPDLIISDLMMPIKDGYELLKEIRSNKRYENIPLILTSAAPLNDSKVDKDGFQGFVRKPFDLDNFLELVNKVLKAKYYDL
jgi:two-component system sensor histidine kinase ChiS